MEKLMYLESDYTVVVGPSLPTELFFLFCSVLFCSTDDRKFELGNAEALLKNLCSSIDLYFLNHVYSLVNGSEYLKFLFAFNGACYFHIS